MFRSHCGWLTIMCAAISLSCSDSAGPGSMESWTAGHLPGGDFSFYRRIKFTDHLHGWAVGDSGRILHTSNGGDSWEFQHSGTTVPLHCAFFVDIQTGWVAGNNATILHTTDAGLTWTVQHPGTNTSGTITSLSFVDALRGWAGVNSGEIAHTTDGGNTWLLQQSGTRWAITSVHFINPMKGWATATNQIILRTVDGGSHWNVEQLENPSPLIFTDVYFVDEQRGWIATIVASSRIESGTLLLYSADGGTTWASEATLPVIYLHSIYFADPNNGWVAGESQIFRTSDGGKRWDPSYSADGDNIVSLSFTDRNHGWALSSKGVVLRYER